MNINTVCLKKLQNDNFWPFRGLKCEHTDLRSLTCQPSREGKRLERMLLRGNIYAPKITVLEEEMEAMRQAREQQWIPYSPVGTDTRGLEAQCQHCSQNSQCGPTSALRYEPRWDIWPFLTEGYHQKQVSQNKLWKSLEGCWFENAPKNHVKYQRGVSSNYLFTGQHQGVAERQLYCESQL